MGERAGRNKINTGGGDLSDRLERNSTGSFDPCAFIDQLHGLAICAKVILSSMITSAPTSIAS